MPSPIVALIGFGAGIPTWLCATVGSMDVSGVAANAPHAANSDATKDVQTGTGAEVTDKAPVDSAVHGSLGLGWRSLGVRGSEEQYREDLNEEPGPLLRELSLGGTAPKGSSIERFLIDAHGLGDPDSYASGDLDTPFLRARARWTRDAYRGNAQDDIHPFDFDQQHASLRVENRADRDDDVHAGIEATWRQRDGMSFGSRNIDFGFVSGFPVRQRETAAGLSGDLHAQIAGFDVALDGGFERLKTRERDEFALPSPTDPAATETEDAGEDGSGTTQRIGLRARRAFGDDVVADFGARYTSASMDSSLLSSETGILFSIDDPVERVRTGDANATARDFDADAGVRWAAATGLALHVRARESRETQDGSSVTQIDLTEGGSMISVTQPHDSHFERRTSVVEGGAEMALSELWDLDVSASYGHDHETIEDKNNDVVVHAFDGGHDEYGGTARLSVDAADDCTLSIAGGYELDPTETTADQSIVEFGNDTVRFAEVRARWKPERGVSIASTLRHEHRESSAFHSQAQVDSLSLAGSWAVSPDWSADASWIVRVQDNSADTTQILLTPLPEQVPVTVTFAGVQQIVSAGVSKALNARLRPRLALSGSISNGDSAYDYEAVSLDVPYRAREHLTVGTQIDLHRFDGDSRLDASDFSSAALVVYATYSF